MTPMRVGLSSATYAPYVALRIARDEGYYAREGVDVRLFPMLGGGYNQEAFVRGDVDVAHVNPSNVVLARAAGVSEIGFGALASRPDGYHVLVRADSPYKTLRDLHGKRMGSTAKGSSTAVYPIWAIRRAGIDMNIVYLHANEIVDGLRNGDVDAITVWAPASYRLLADGTARSVLDFGAALDPCVPACWVASGTWLAERLDVIRGFLRGTARGIAYLKADRARAIGLISAFVGETDEGVLGRTFDSAILPLVESGYVTREALIGALDVAVIGGILAAMPALESVFDWSAFAADGTVPA